MDPRSLSSLMVDVGLKLLQPTSTGQTIAFQSRCSASNAMSTSRPFPLVHQHYPHRVLSVLPSSEEQGVGPEHQVLGW